MQPIQFPNLRRVLCIGAHVDDIEIGCGGALLRMLSENKGLEVYWLVATSDETRSAEAENSAKKFLVDSASYELKLLEFRDGYLPYLGSNVKDAFFELRSAFEPDLIFTHRLEDRHQDHRLLAELTWNTFRNHPILEYEIPKYEGDLGSPNLYIPLSESTAQRKVDLLLECFESQHGKAMVFNLKRFASLMRIRGLESKAEPELAEAFTARKIVL